MEPNIFAAAFNSFCVENNMLGVLELSTCFQCIKQLHLTVYIDGDGDIDGTPRSVEIARIFI